MEVSVSKHNSKLGVIPSVSLPPVLSCRERCPCSDDCYARKGRFRFKNVKDSLRKNYDFYKESPTEYFDSVKRAINNGFFSYKYFRWHAAGDIPDEKYWLGMIRLAQELEETSFLCFTKKFELINDYVRHGGSIPTNLNVVFSAWGKDLMVENPYQFPVAYVKFKDRDSGDIPTSSEKCNGGCMECLRCWTIRHGQSVVFDKH